MTAEARRAAEHDVAHAITRFFNNLDARRYDAMWDLMAPGGYWNRSGEILDSREVFLAAMAKRPEHLTIRHLINNLDVEVLGEDSAQAYFAMVLFRFIGDAGGKPAPLEGPQAVTAWKAQASRVDGDWKIAALSFEMLFARP